MKCPTCGSKAVLVGLPAGGYPATFRCYNLSQHRGEYNFGGNDMRLDKAEVKRECAAAEAESKANAEKIRGEQ